eukprot:GHUV01000630.1.p1 GENE.GHUV01000630.1~~GHUV01000630.1.p1  ORF type:complete len:388 (+),score=25.50 GHUV01000630.1:179-1342(+)
MGSRLLLGPGHSHGASVVQDSADSVAGADPSSAAEDLAHALVHASTLDLRIAAIFVVWFGAVLFGLPTLVLKQFRDSEAVLPRLLRSFAGGVIIALALVHIIPEAVGELNSLMRFPIGGCTILFGILVLVIIDNSLAAFLAPDHYKQHIRDQIAFKEKEKIHEKQEKHGHGHGGHAPAAAADGAHGHDHHQHDLPVVGGNASAHSHQCLRSMNASNWVANGSKPTRSIRQYVTAYTMELGCIFHSVIIGIGVGVITEDRHLVITLMIALAIHQGLEALALGSVLALTSFTKFKKFSMLLLYAVTTPIGIAIGIAIASSYDPDSVTSRAVQGTLNGVSGGMLLYIGMYQLVAEEFSREDILVKPRLRNGMYAALCCGAASMCILGLWA